MATIPGVVQLYTLPLASNQRLDFYWNPPLSDGGSPILSYVIEARTSVGGAVVATNTFGAIQQYGFLTGLTNNVIYFCSIYATNAIGNGPSADFRPFSPGVSAPSIPTALGVSTNQTTLTSAIVQWAPPVSDGGNTIFWYSVIAQPTDSSVSSVRLSADGQTQSTIALQDLSFNKTYNLSVNAVNTVGYSPTISTIFRTATDNVYVTGRYDGTLSNFNSDGSLASTLANSVNTDTFVVKYNTDGCNMRYRWGSRITGSGNTIEFGTGITNDQFEGTYSIGYYQSPLTIYNGDGSAFSNILSVDGAARNVYYVKYDFNGNVKWATRTSAEFDCLGWAASADRVGGVYFSFQYAGVASNYNANNTLYSTIAYSAANDAGIVKYNADTGFVEWNARMASEGQDMPFALSANSNDVYVFGRYANNLTPYNANGTAFSNTLVISGNYDVFTVRYNSVGTVQWAAKIAGTMADEAYGGASDSTGVYVTGLYESSPLSNFNADNTLFGTLSNSGNKDVFLTKYNISGFVQWSTRLTSIAGDDVSLGLAADDAGGVYVTGYYQGTLNIYNANGNQSIQPSTLTYSGGVNGFIVKYNTSNGFAQWATRITATGGDARGQSISLINSNIYLTGRYLNEGLIYRTDGTLYSTISGGGNVYTGYIVKYDFNGNIQTVTRMTPSGGMCEPNSIACGPK